jgi:DNA-binding transcriptional ArsR family regulator/DNA gyrase inhibitor GyrI
MDGYTTDRSDEELVYTLDDSSEDIVLILHALANEKRLQMLTSLLKNPGTFHDLQEVTGLGKTALSHHLQVLVKAGMLTHTGRGHYELSCDGKELLSVVGVTYKDSKRRKEVEAAKRADYIHKIHTKEVVTMEEFKVELVELEPMHIASVRAVSTTPEHDAWEKMRTWAEPRGLLEDIKKHPVFGFNSPDPAPGQKEYGYEFWIQVEPGTEPEGEVQIKEFEGGLYAVTTCNLQEELESDFFKEEGYLESWKKIVDWVESSEYEFGDHQCLEKAHEPGVSDEELVLDIYCPIKK